jgi:hypothetical protein
MISEFCIDEPSQNNGLSSVSKNKDFTIQQERISNYYNQSHKLFLSSETLILSSVSQNMNIKIYE